MAQPLAQTGNIAETGRSLRKKRVQRLYPASGQAGPLLAVSVRWLAGGCSGGQGPRPAVARGVPCATPSRKES